MKIQPFIFNWKNQFDKTCKIENSLNEIFEKVTVVNSDDDNKKSHWLNIGENAYFTDQFYAALNNFDGDVLFHIQGDVEYDNWKKLIEDAKKYINYYNPGIYAPNIDYTWWTSDLVDLPIKTHHQNIKVVSHTDETVWFITKDTINEFYKRKIDFSKNKFGWGWDLVMISICFLNKKLVIRDYNHKIIHPKHTNYNKDLANIQLKTLINELDNDLKTTIYNIRHYKKDKLKNIIV
jgi:hypothetical protein